jgi:hypothetical protein
MSFFIRRPNASPSPSHSLFSSARDDACVIFPASVSEFDPSRPGMLAGKTPKKEKALPHLMRVLLVPLLLPRAGAMNAIFGEQTTC